MPPRDSPHILIRLEEADKEALRKLAAKEGCDMTAIVRPLILGRLGRGDVPESRTETRAVPSKKVVCRLKKR